MGLLARTKTIAPNWALNVGRKALYAFWAWQRIWIRRRTVKHYLQPRQKIARAWLKQDRETANFYYDLTDLNKQHLAHFVAMVTGTHFSVARAMMDELMQDKDLFAHLQSGIRASYLNRDIEVAYGRRLGWYAIARIVKPRILVETGVDHGVGACVLAKALIRNTEEGSPGRYYGLDIHPQAGRLLTGHYAEIGEVIYGDSVESLARFQHQIDLFISDSDHHEAFEEAEYAALAPHLAPRAIVLSDNSHVTDALGRFALSRGYRFLYFREVPLNHWYPGAGIGAAFPAK